MSFLRRRLLMNMEVEGMEVIRKFFPHKNKIKVGYGIKQRITFDYSNLDIQSGTVYNYYSLYGLLISDEVIGIWCGPGIKRDKIILPLTTTYPNLYARLDLHAENALNIQFGRSGNISISQEGYDLSTGTCSCLIYVPDNYNEAFLNGWLNAEHEIDFYSCVPCTVEDVEE